MSQERTATLVCTHRNPVDCVSSNLLFLDKAPTQANIQEQIDLLKEHGLVQLCRLIKRKDIVLLKYESFYQNHSLIFRSLESFFDMTISEEQKSTISEKYQVANVKEKFASKFEHAFQFDKENHWHGNHISAFNGRPNTATEVLNKSQIDMIQQELREYINVLGYELIE